MAKTYIGIEIGNYRMKMAVCEEETVKRMVAVELPENTVREGQIVSWEAMADFIKETLKEQHIPGKNAAVVLPEGLTYVLRVNMPAMTVDQLKVNLPYEFHDYITDEKEKYFYDYAVVGMERDDKGTPKNMDLLAVAVRKTSMERYRNMMKRAGLKLVLAAPEIVAYEYIIRRHEELEGEETECVPDYGVLNIGHTSVKLHIYKQGHYDVTCNIEPGLEAMTSIISDATGADRHIAELYKQKNREDIWNHEDCVSLYNRIAVELMRVLNFYNFNHPDNTLEKVYYCGGGAMITPLLDEISSIIEQELVGIDTLFPAGSGERENLLNGAAAAGITWE